MKLSPDLEARILAMPGTRVNGAEVCAPAPPPPPAFADEAAFQAWVVAYAKDRGWLTYHTFDSRRSTPGFPDLVMLRTTPAGTRLVVAELKMPGNKPTEAQRCWLRAFERSGAEVFTWWPEHVPEIREVLK